MKTIKMINCPKMAEFIIFEALFNVIWSISDCFASFVSDFSFSLSVIILKAINSTIITAPSIIIPKSIAPRLIKLASTPKMFIIEMANNKLNGITEATTKPERKLPSNKTTTKMTINDPKIRFSDTVKVVLPISSLRSKNPLM